MVAQFPSLVIGWKGRYPVKIMGTFIVRDNEGRTQGDFEIEVQVPTAYPYAFPILKEVSEKIPREDNFHMGKDGTACVENPRKIEILQRQGVSLFDFFSRYAHPYFCWQLVAKEDGLDGLPGWSHGSTGIKEYYKEVIGAGNEVLIKKMISLIVNRNLPGRNDLCFCDSGQKYKWCHMNHMQELSMLPIATLSEDLKLFDNANI